MNTYVKGCVQELFTTRHFTCFPLWIEWSKAFSLPGKLILLMWHTHLKYFWSSPDRNNVVGFSSLIPQCIVPVTVIGILSNSNAQACVPSKLRILKNWGHKLVLFVSSAHVMMLGIQLILQSSPLLNGSQISCIIEGVQRHCLAYSSF